MRHGDLKTLFVLAVLVSAGYLLVANVPSHTIAKTSSQAASGALAYVDEDTGAVYYQNDQLPYYEDPSMVSDSWLPDTYLTNNPPPDAEIDYSAPMVDTSYWPVSSDVVYSSESDPYYTYDPYETTITVDEPWYVTAFPGMGQVITPLLPPVVRPTPIQPPPPPRPSCAIAASPRTIYAGGTTVVSWTTQNAARSILSGVGDVTGTGSRTYSNISAPQTFTLSVSGLGGSSSCSAQVSVLTQQAAPTCALSVHPDTIRAGETANLAWLSENATSIQLGDQNVPQSGGRVVAPTQTTTYRMTVANPGGQIGSCAAQLVVQ